MKKLLVLVFFITGCGVIHKQIPVQDSISLTSIPNSTYGIIIGDSISNQVGQRNDLLQDKFGFPIVNFGIGGNTTSQVANRWVDDVYNNSPELVILLVGVNDFRDGIGKDSELYKANMQFIFGRNKSKLIVCNIPLAADMDTEQRRIIQELNLWLMNQQPKYNYKLVDLYSFSIYNRQMYKDSVHPNHRGVEEIINLL